jgi:hypothetical protein
LTFLRLRNGSNVHIGEAFSCVTFADGAEITGAPQGTAEQEQQARDLGVPVEQMVAEHDPLHEILAAALELQYSPALRAAVERSGWTDLTRAEEGAVLALQAYLACLGISVEEAAQRLGVLRGDLP